MFLFAPADLDHVHTDAAAEHCRQDWQWKSFQRAKRSFDNVCEGRKLKSHGVSLGEYEKEQLIFSCKVKHNLSTVEILF